LFLEMKTNNLFIGGLDYITDLYSIDSSSMSNVEMIRKNRRSGTTNF
jgi:hypothetical protein